MANYTSQLDQFNRVESPIDIKLMNNVLAAKQGQYDKGAAEIDQTLADFKAIDAKLLRPQDREYLANNIKALTDQINSSGKLDLSNSGVTRSIKSHIKSALDPTVINAVAQGNKITSFQATIAEKQKTKPELYSDVNYQYALKQAGVQKYLNGETDEVGNLNYDDYINAPKVLDESIAKWAKDYGFHTEFVNGDPNQLIYASAKKEVLTKQEIISKLKTTLDPKLSKQLQIDSDYHYSNQPPGQIDVDATNYYTKQNAEIEQKLLEIKAERTGQTEAKKIQLDNDEKYYLGLKADNTKTLTDKNFDNDYQKYQIYTIDLLGGIADNYDRNDTVEIKYVDNNLKVAQFNADIEYKQATLAQGQQRIDIAKQQASAADLANTIASGGTVGSVTDAADPTAGTKSDSKVANEKHVNDYAELQAALEGSSKEYNALQTPAEKADFIKNLAASNSSVSINNDTLTPEAREKLDTYKASLGTIKNVRQAIVTTVGDTLIHSYNDLLGSSTDFNNLARTAPLTAKYAKAGIPLTQLSKQEVAAIKHEMATTSLNYDDGLSSEERESLVTYTKNLENQSYLSPEQKKAMKGADKSEVGLFSGYGDQLSGFGKVAGNALAESAEHVFGWFDNNPNTNWTNTRAKYTKENQQHNEQFDRGAKKSQLAALDRGLGIYSQDSNLTEIEAGDFKKGTKLGFHDRLQNALKASTATATIEYKKLAENAKNYQNLSFNPEDKKQAPSVTTIQTQIAAVSGGAVEFAKGSVITTALSKDGSTINVTYIPKGEKGEVKDKVTVPIPSGNLAGLANQLTDKSVPFINSKLNKNAPARRTTYETPVDSKAREELLYKLHSTYGEAIFPEKVMIAQLGQGSKVPTQIEMRAYGAGQPPEVVSKINEISTEVYDVVWTPAQIGNGWVGTVKDSKNNTITLPNGASDIRLEKDYNEGGMRSTAIDIINQVKIGKISKLIQK